MPDGVAQPTLPTPNRFVLWYIEVRIWIGLRFFKQLPIKGAKSYPGKLVPTRNARVINLGFGQFLKTRATLNEVHALKVIRKFTSIPVPRVHGAWQRPDMRAGCCYLLMSKIAGETLEDAWPDLKMAQRVPIARQLSSYVAQLRKLRQPRSIKGQIVSLIGGPIRDAGLNPIWVHPDCYKETFDSLETFVDFLQEPFSWRGMGVDADNVEVLSQCHSSKIVLTHNDFAMRNIMVDKKTAKVTGVIDWEAAAWMPMYWEAFKAEFTEIKRTPRMKAFFAAAFGKFPEELKVLYRREKALAT